MKYLYYCPYCGEENFPDATRCSKCCSIVGLAKSRYTYDVYKAKSCEKYGDYKHWKEFLLLEIRENPLFDEEKFNYVVTQEEYAERRKQMNYKIPTYLDSESQHIPKCPTCGSTNIEKISGIKRATSEIMFGIFSPTIGKTFCCKNCGYKW